MTSILILRRLFGIKSRLQVEREVLREPTVRKAIQTLHQADRVLAEMEAMERRNDRR